MGIMIGGALTAVHGWHLNVNLPKRRADQWEATERSRLESAADAGVLVIDHIQPRSLEEAAQMIERVIEDGRRVVGKHEPHSVFWIPMEIVGIPAAIVGLILTGTTLVGALTA